MSSSLDFIDGEMSGGGDSGRGYYGRPKVSAAVRKQEQEDIRLEVQADIEKKYSKDKNPVTQFLLEIGVLEDIEVLRRLIMNAGDNSSIYLYNNKLNALKTYISSIKETVLIREKQAKIDKNDNPEDDFGGIEVSIKR